MNIEMLQSSLKRLRLSGIAKVLPIRLHEAEVAELPYTQFLENLLKEELNKRSSNLHNKRLRKAQFYEPIRSLEMEFLYQFGWYFRVEFEIKCLKRLI
jgi:DNA replication protein DnaC